MVKINKNSVVGIASLVVFMIFGIVGISGGVLKYVLFGFLHLLLAAATFVLMSFAIEGQGKNRKDGHYFWCDLAPFALILILAKLVAGWDFYIIFYFIGMVYVALNETLRRMNEGFDLKNFEFYKPMAVALGSVVLYVAFSFAGGSPV